MSARSDNTKFATHFDFETEQVSIFDLIVHLRTMAMEPEGFGLPNAMACAAAADLLCRLGRFLPTEEPGSLIAQLRSIDSNTWGEMQ